MSLLAETFVIRIFRCDFPQKSLTGILYQKWVHANHMPNLPCKTITQSHHRSQSIIIKKNFCHPTHLLKKLPFFFFYYSWHIYRYVFYTVQEGSSGTHTKLNGGSWPYQDQRAKPVLSWERLTLRSWKLQEFCGIGKRRVGWTGSELLSRIKKTGRTRGKTHIKKKKKLYGDCQWVFERKIQVYQKLFCRRYKQTMLQNRTSIFKLCLACVQLASTEAP